MSSKVITGANTTAIINADIDTDYPTIPGSVHVPGYPSPTKQNSTKDEQSLTQMAASDTLDALAAGVNIPGPLPSSQDQQNTLLNTKSHVGRSTAKVADITKLLSGNIPAESAIPAFLVFDELNTLSASCETIPDTLSDTLPIK